MTLRPAGLNKAIACLFMVGSALFLLGSVPAYVNAVGATADSITYVIGSIFTAASFNQLLQAQTPAMTEVAHRTRFVAVVRSVVMSFSLEWIGQHLSIDRNQRQARVARQTSPSSLTNRG